MSPVDLAELVGGLNRQADDRVLVGPETMDDAAVIKLRDDLATVLTADIITPVVDDPYWFGAVAAANSLSDIWAMGANPVAAINLCCFPGSGLPMAAFGDILRGGLDKIHEAGASLVGGHTVKDEELKYGLSVQGVVHPDKVTPNTGAKPGDTLILTKPIGTGVLISGGKKGLISQESLQSVVEMMATLNRVAGETMVEFGAKGATDITGFGLAGHGLEMAEGSKASLRIHFDQLPIFDFSLELIEKGVRTGVTDTNRQLCSDRMSFSDDIQPREQALFYDPQTSGGLLISIASDRAQDLLSALKEKGVEQSVVIGEVFESSKPGIEVVR